MSSMKKDRDSAISSQSPNHRRIKSREVSSRYLSPTSTTTTSYESEFSSPKGAISPVRRKQGMDSVDYRKHRSVDDGGVLRGQLWPSTMKKTELGSTLADHLGNDRLRDFLDRKSNEKSEKSKSVFALTKQRSCSVFKRFESDQIEKNSNNNGSVSKENHQPFILGGSSRYTGKNGFQGKSSPNVNSSSKDFNFVSGRLSIDESSLFRKSESFTSTTLDSESDFSDVPSANSDLSSKKLGMEVPSKYMNHVSRRSRRGTSDSNIQNPMSSEDSSILKKFTIKNAIKRANSLTGYKSSKSQWALSPGRSGSPPMSVESKEKLISFSSLKPPTSPSHSAKGVDKFLNLGFDFFRSKKSPMSSALTGLGTSDTVYQLRLLDNRLMQWRYANAKSEAVNKSLHIQAESNLVYAWNGVMKVQRSVMQKKMQYEKEKLEMKLNFIIQSQIKLLEAWGEFERQHMSAITVTKDFLHSIVCKVPLMEGAEVEIPSFSVTLKHAYELTVSMKSMLTSFPALADDVAALLSELAEVVSQEKLLLDEFHDLFQTISFLEVQERSMKGGLIQLQCWQQQYLQQQITTSQLSIDYM